jgi:hypothetical protein
LLNVALSNRFTRHRTVRTSIIALAFLFLLITLLSALCIFNRAERRSSLLSRISLLSLASFRTLSNASRSTIIDIDRSFIAEADTKKLQLRYRAYRKSEYRQLSAKEYKIPHRQLSRDN